MNNIINTKDHSSKKSTQDDLPTPFDFQKEIINNVCNDDCEQFKYSEFIEQTKALKKIKSNISTSTKILSQKNLKKKLNENLYNFDNNNEAKHDDSNPIHLPKIIIPNNNDNVKNERKTQHSTGGKQEKKIFKNYFVLNDPVFINLKQKLEHKEHIKNKKS